MKSYTQDGKEYRGEAAVTPFESAEQAWFWFILAQQARVDGARFVAKQGSVIRPCEPVDILQILDRLYRTRRLLRDHLLVLRHYGRRQLPPDPYRVKEIRSAALWKEALERLEPMLERKGIVEKKNFPQLNWHEQALVYENMSFQMGAA